MACHYGLPSFRNLNLIRKVLYKREVVFTKIKIGVLAKIWTSTHGLGNLSFGICSYSVE